MLRRSFHAIHPEFRRLILVVFTAFVLMLGAIAAARGQVSFTGTQISVAGTALGSVPGVAADGKGNLYIADSSNGQLLRVPANAGLFGAPEVILSGLSSPSGIAADWSGNVYIADTGNHRVLMLAAAASGAPSAVQVGAGFGSPSSVAVDSVGNVYVADSTNNDVVELPHLASGYGSPVVMFTGLNSPMGVTIDPARNLYIADTGNNRIIKEIFSANGYVTRQFVGNGLIAPGGIYADKSSNLYIADTGNSRVVEEPWFAGANRYGTQVVVGSGFESPAGVVVDWSGNLFVADKRANRVMQIVTKSIDFGAIAVGASTTVQSYNFSVSAGTVIGNVGIYTQGVTGKEFIDGENDSCIAQVYVAATLCSVNVIFSPSGTGARSGSVVLYDPQGNALAIAFLSGSGIAPQAAIFPAAQTALGSNLSGPAGVAVDGAGNIYIADTGNNRIVEIPWTGAGYGGQITVPVNGLSIPMGLAIDGAGSLYIVSNGNDKVVKLPWTGSGFGPHIKVGNGLYGPSNVAVDTLGSVYITDTLDSGVDKLLWTGSGFGQSQILGNYRKFPVGVAVDGNGNVYFSMPYQSALVEVPHSGSQYLTQVYMHLNGVSFPSAIAVDANSNLYVLDGDNNRVVMLPWNGTGFGAQITVASGFNSPGGLAVDSHGNLYVADSGNNQIIKIDLSTPGNLNFATTYLGSTSADSAQVSFVENIGNQPLMLNSVSYPLDFPEDPSGLNACTQDSSIGQGSACGLAIDFTPTFASPSLSETVSLASNSMGANNALHVVPVSGTSIGKAQQSINFAPISSTTYGAGPIALNAVSTSGLQVTCRVVSGPAQLSSSGSTLTITGAGTVVIRASQSGNAQFAAAPPVIMTFAVLPAPLTVTPTNVTAIYGSVQTTFNYTISGFVLGQSAQQVVTGKAAVAVNASGAPGAGSYTLTATMGTLTAANYTFVFGTGTLTVNPAQLQVKALNATSVYGSPLPVLQWAFSGFVNGDGAGAIIGSPAMSTTAAANSPVESYTIVPGLGTLRAKNYAFVFVSATLQVTTAALTVTADSLTSVYGQGLPALTYSIRGFVGSDSASAIHGVPVLTTNASNGCAAGTYAIAVSIGNLSSPNYAFTLVPGVLSIQKAVLTVIPSPASMTYGGKVPALQFTLSGLVNGDLPQYVIAGAPLLTTTATSQSVPGAYAISALVGTMTAKNYTFVFANGSLTVNKAVLTVKPRSVSMTYGGNLPAFGYDLVGFVNGDGVTAVSGAPALSTSASAKPSVGTYTISGTTGTLSSNHYSFNVSTGTLTVNKAVLNVMPLPSAMTYGGSLPNFVPTYSGFVNGDANSVVSGTALFKTTVSATTPVGNYGVQVDVSGLTATNYSFAAISGTVAVQKAVLTVTPAPASMVYGGAMPQFAFSARGFVNGDTASVISGTPTYATSASAASPAGNYAVSVTAGTLTATNYAFAFVSGTITVNKAVLTVTADPMTMTYGSTPPAYTYHLTGFVNGDVSSVVSGAPVLSGGLYKTSGAGTYTINAGKGTLSASNYNFVLVNGTATINKAVLTISPKPAVMTYGGATPAFSVTYSGFQNTEGPWMLSGAQSFTTAANSSSAVGTYPVTASVGTLAANNYTFAFTPGVITVNPAALKVTADNISMKMGTAVPTLTYTVKGLVNGDTAATATTGSPALTTTATSTSAAGNYPIAATLGTMKASNYALTAANGTLIVTK